MPADELRHAPGAGTTPAEQWEESWSFDFAGSDGSYGGYARLGLVPSIGKAWFWAAVVGADRTTVAVRDHDVGLPRGDGLEVRGPGLWADLVCEEPLDHWSVGIEAFGVGFDDPGDGWGDERGAPTAVGFDLGWEATSPPVGHAPDSGAQSDAPSGGYSQACKVAGDVLVGVERIVIDGWGARSHQWGPLDWWRCGDRRSEPNPPDLAPSPRMGLPGFASGRFEDGSGFLRRPAIARYDERGLPQSGLVDGAGTGTGYGHSPVVARPLAVSAVLVPPKAPGTGSARLARVLCLYETAAGLSGTGWADWLHAPQ